MINRNIKLRQVAPLKLNQAPSMKKEQRKKKTDHSRVSPLMILLLRRGAIVDRSRIIKRISISPSRDKSRAMTSPDNSRTRARASERPVYKGIYRGGRLFTTRRRLSTPVWLRPRLYLDWAIEKENFSPMDFCELWRLGFFELCFIFFLFFFRFSCECGSR